MQKEKYVKYKEMLPPQVQEVLTSILEEGFEGYLVGGAVRDMLLGKTPKDWDIVTTAPPEVLMWLFQSRGLELVGQAFGVFRMTVGGIDVEIARTRKERGSLDNRHPEEVTFVATVEEDVQRRDYTINALLYDCVTGTVIDCVGGLGDIKTRTIRAIGDPNKRYQEDALRIVRGIRLAAQLGFRVEADTKAAMLDSMELLQQISKERVDTEIFKCLCLPYISKVLQDFALSYTLCNAVQPHIPIRCISTNVQPLTKFVSEICKLSWFYYILRKDLILDRTYSKRTIFLVQEILRLNELMPQMPAYLLYLCKGDRELYGYVVEFTYTLNRDVEGRKEVYMQQLPNLCGGVKELVLKPLDMQKIDSRITGKKIGELQRAMYLAVTLGQIENEKRDLVKYVKTYMKKAEEN